LSPSVPAGPKYPLAPLRRRHRPPVNRPYREYRDCVRLEFAFTCVYCLSAEREVAPGAAYGGFEIEQFRPQGQRRFRRLRNEYSNLLWACRACNLAKGDAWPTDDEVSRGERFVDPCAEPLGAHLGFEGAGVVALDASPAGEFMLVELNLNSRQHVHRREERQRRATAFALAEGTCQVLTELAARSGASPEISAQLAHVRALLDALRPDCWPASPPWDAPETCHCVPATVMTPMT